MPDASGRFIGISTQGVTNRWLEKVSRRKELEREERAQLARRLAAMAMGRAHTTN